MRKIFLILMIWAMLPACLHANCRPDNKVLNPEDEAVEINYYKNTKKKQTLGSVILMPPTGGSTYLDKRYAKNLCKAGFDVQLVERWKGMAEDTLELEVHQRLLTRAQNAVDVLTENASSQCVVILGTSVGGIHAATALGRSDKLKAGFFIVAGAPIADVIAYSNEERLKEARALRKKKYGFTSTEEYAKALRAKVDLGPLVFSEKAKDKPVGIVIATEDDTVLTEHQLRLQEALTPDLVFSYDSSHISTIIKTWWNHTDDIVEFFKKACGDK